MLILSSCSTLIPNIFKTGDDISTDGVIQINIDKEAFYRDTQSVDVLVHIQNKEK